MPGRARTAARTCPANTGSASFPASTATSPTRWRRIPYGPTGTVADNLVDTTRCQLNRVWTASCRSDRPLAPHAQRRTRRPGRLSRFLGGDLDLTHDDLKFFGSKIWQIVTSCRERRNEGLRKDRLVGLHRRRAPLARLPEAARTRHHALAGRRESATPRARRPSATSSSSCCSTSSTPGPSTDRVLNGPTNDVWIDPWRRYLESQGVALSPRLEGRRGVVRWRAHSLGARSSEADRSSAVAGDYFVFAMPVEDVIDLITPEMIRADPALGAPVHARRHHRVDERHPDLSQGRRAARPRPQHLRRFALGAHVDLTGAVLEARRACRDYGDGTVKGIISVDISEWEEPGLNGKAAKECTPEEIKAEVWEQLKRSLNYGDASSSRTSSFTAGVSTRASFITRTARWPTRNRCSSISSTRGSFGPTPCRGFPICFSPPTTFGPTPTWRRWRRRTKPLGERSTASSMPRGRPRHRAQCGTCTSPRSSRPGASSIVIRFAQGLPWDDTLVRFGLSFADLADKAIQALESSEDDGPSPARSCRSVGASPGVLVFADRQADAAVISDLRREATSVVERLVRLLAVRFADTERTSRAPGAGSTGRPGRVEIIPR